MFKKFLFLAVAGFFLLSFAYTNAKAADYVLYKAITFKGSGGQWLARAYQERNVDTNSNTPAKLCFSNNGGRTNQYCYTAVINQYYPDLKENMAYNLQFINKFQPISLKQLGQGILFVPTFSGGGSGTLSLLTVWIPKGNKIENILPKIELNGLDQFDFTRNGILIVAHRIWGDNEAHLQPHRYEISIYKYDKSNGHYTFATKYTTTRSYSASTNVIGAEMPTINTHL